MRLRGEVVRFYFVVFFFKLGGEVSPWERTNKTISFSSSCFDGITRKVRLGIKCNFCESDSKLEGYFISFEPIGDINKKVNVALNQLVVLVF